MLKPITSWKHLRRALRARGAAIYCLLVLAALLSCDAQSQSSRTAAERKPYVSDAAGHVRTGSPEIYKVMTPVEGEQAPTWTSFPEDVIQEGCVQFDRCRAYMVYSYDGNWHNKYGNEGLFILRFKNVWITAFCGGKPGSCGHIEESVGKTIWLDDDMNGVIVFSYQRMRSDNDDMLIVIKRGMDKPRH
jgi:hypothetical protein